MTTIDSDSESQDSDDGRRFRFEATRKDDGLKLQSQNKRRRASPLSKSLNYRSRSGDRDRGSSYSNRRDYDKGKQDHHHRDRKEDKGRESSRDYSSKNNSSNKESRHTNNAAKEKNSNKETNESNKNLITDNEKRFNNDSRTHRDHKNSKDSSRSREYKSNSHPTRNLKESNKIRETKDKDKDQDHLKSPKRDRERGSQGRRSRDTTNHQQQQQQQHTHNRSSREKYNSNRSRDRSDNNKDKERMKQLEEKISSSSSKNNSSSSFNESKKNSLIKKLTERKDIERRISGRRRDAHSPSKILDQIGSDSESDLGALDHDIGPVMALDSLEDCREMNLSDFDIISDTEGSSSSSDNDNDNDNDHRDEKNLKIEKTMIDKQEDRGEILTPHYYGPKITKRVSRRQYERLVRRQEAINHRRLEELYKVNHQPNERKDGNSTSVDESYCSNNSVGAVSDFLLGPRAPLEETHRRRSSKNYKNSKDDRNDDGDDEENRESAAATNIQCLKNVEKINLLDYSNPNSCKQDKEIEKEEGEDNDGEIYGPSLPPLEKRNELNEEKEEEKEIERTKSLKGDKREENLSSESRNMIIGPSLPPGFTDDTKSEEFGSEESGSGVKPAAIMGPSLPPHLKRELSDSTSSLDAREDLATVRSDHSSHNSIFGPTLPPHFVSKSIEEKKSDSDSDEGFLGPMPPDHPAALNDYVQIQLEERANRMKNKLDSKNTVVDKREEWMIQLPSAKAANLGLDSKRQFRNRAGPDMSDRSSWTDTPADKIKKREDRLLGKVKISDPAKESERLAIQERDRAMEKMAEKHASKKRKESLLDIHKKKLSKKKKKEEKEAKESGGKQTRRPFDRDIDLQANRFDEAQKKSILNKAQLLNDRFSRGESKFL